MSSWRQRNSNTRREDRGHGSIEIYSIGTKMRGTDRSVEDSLSGYTPIMVDHRGNRRFHGAFTGGFSAGHFNTVGSAQGYKAKYETWTSSRNNKNKQSITQTPMDFMDDEDMATNTNLLTTSKPFNSLNNDSMNNIFNQTKSNVSKHLGDTMSNYLMVNKNAMCNHTKGIQLLKKCGWRTGTNIGDKSNMIRLRLLLKKQDELLLNNTKPKDSNDLLFGEHILNTENNQDTSHNTTQLVSIYRPKMKTDCHGIGYDADTEDNDTLHTNPVASSTSGQKRSNPNHNHAFGPLKKKRKLLSSATGSTRHGLSALEEVEIGDDVYGDEDHEPHIGYDTFIAHSDEDDHDADDDILLMNDKQRKSIRHQHRNPIRFAHKPRTQQRARSKDGSLPMDGFVVSSSGDHYQYNLKQQIRKHRERRTFQSNPNASFMEFQSNTMDIDKAFVHKFANIDLKVGSYLCRDRSYTKRKSSKLWADTSTIPRNIPDAQRVAKVVSSKTNNIAQPLQSRFTAEETISGDVTMSGLRAGLTLSHHIPGKKNDIHKAELLLKDIRDQFGSENAEKLLRFDMFLADKLGIDAPMETDNQLLFDDGNNTQFELDKERTQFERKWQELEQYKLCLYPDKPRIRAMKTKDPQTSNAESNRSGMHDTLTRTVETWMPDRLLCKRCNIRNPYLGMEDDEPKTKPLCANVSNKSYKALMKRKEGRITSKGEQIAAMLEETQSNKEPPILQLKQLKTWNSYLQETQHKQDTEDKETMVKKMEMKSFIDGILNDSDSSGSDDEGEMEKETIIDGRQQEMSLFKSIFEDDEATDSDTDEASESEEIEQVQEQEEEEEKEEVVMPVQRKKFEFITKSKRDGKKSLGSKFGNIGGERNKTNIQIESVHMEEESEAEVLELKVETHEQKKENDMVWVVDNDSSDSNQENESEKKRKRKKRKQKKTKKKAKHKRKKRSKKNKYK
eukprot:952360_1